ncbi:ABC transporter ATP-binding protein [Paenibacillus fonticola]|uniref:ABC transporter ATP-binding protein n=1 Tax=Paenibacillus fonticola TaxID=379896 RepID=UPI000361AA9D|nr:ABC transporter ATP-binding protein [Paenibacillus fonticola]
MQWNATVFEAKGLTKRYGPACALQEINMRIRPGEIYGCIGENGAGKTTLMRIIGGLVHPTSGEISLFGISDRSQLHAVRQQIGFLIDTPGLYPHLNAEQNLAFYCHNYGITDQRRIAGVLEQVSLSDTGNKKVSEYSLGMRQRLGLAIALLNQPQFLVLDEPINGLDPSGIIELRNILEHLAKENGVAILISSHFLNELQLLATTFGFMHKGRLIHEISARELLKTGGTRICVQTSDPAATAEILKRELQIAEISMTSAGDVYISKESTDMEKLMSVLLRHSISIQGIHLSTPNLENYYMDLIGGNS